MEADRKQQLNTLSVHTTVKGYKYTLAGLPRAKRIRPGLYYVLIFVSKLAPSCRSLLGPAATEGTCSEVVSHRDR